MAVEGDLRNTPRPQAGEQSCCDGFKNCASCASVTWRSLPICRPIRSTTTLSAVKDRTWVRPLRSKMRRRFQPGAGWKLRVNAKACAIAMALWIATLASDVHADAGEARVYLDIDNELALLHHPGVDYSQGGGVKEYLPRIGGGISFGVSEWLDIGFGVRAAVPIETMEQRVNYQTFQDGDLFSSYWDIFVPIALTVRWAVAPTFAVALQAQAGGLVTRWNTTQMQSAASIFDEVPRTYPIDRMTQWEFDIFWRAGLLGEWRPSDWFVLGVGPYLSRTIRFGDWHAGIDLCVSYVFGVGTN